MVIQCGRVVVGMNHAGDGEVGCEYSRASHAVRGLYMTAGMSLAGGSG